MICIGIDGSLNSTGFCVYDTDLPGVMGPTLLSTPLKIDYPSQFERMIYQRNNLKAFVRQREDFGDRVRCLSIEKPFVLPMRSRGRGGEQSSNLFALYTLFLDAARDLGYPICCFHISQLRSLIHGRAGTTKDDTIQAAFRATGATVTDDIADAFFVAKFGAMFWDAFQCGEDPEYYPFRNVFMSEKLSSKKKPTGMIWHPGDAWFNFNSNTPTELPLKWQLKSPSLKL